jgi:hypothetical protein
MKVDRDKFEAVIQQMLKTPPLPAKSIPKSKTSKVTSPKQTK